MKIIGMAILHTGFQRKREEISKYLIQSSTLHSLYSNAGLSFADFSALAKETISENNAVSSICVGWFSSRSTRNGKKARLGNRDVPIIALLQTFRFNFKRASNSSLTENDLPTINLFSNCSITFQEQILLPRRISAEQRSRKISTSKIQDSSSSTRYFEKNKSVYSHRTCNNRLIKAANSHEDFPGYSKTTTTLLRDTRGDLPRRKANDGCRFSSG